MKKGEKAPARPASRAASVSELDELEDTGKAVAAAAEDTVNKAAEASDDMFQASEKAAPELDTAGLEKIAEQLKKYNLGDDLPEDDDFTDTEDTDNGDDSDFAVTDFRNV